MRRILISGLVRGAAATIVMDLLNAVAAWAGAVERMNPRLTGRLADGWVRGKFLYRGLAEVADVPGALLKGITAHYVIGAAFGLCFAWFLAVLGRARAGVALPLFYGLCTTAASLLVLFPSVGIGFFAAHAPDPYALVGASTLNHLFYGLGLALAFRGYAAVRETGDLGLSSRLEDLG